MPKLHEIIAVVSGKKGETEKAVTALYHKAQKGELFDGLSKAYQPVDEENGEKLPPERKRPQLRVDALVGEAAAAWTPLFDLILTMDVGNQQAKGVIEVDGQKLVENLPVPTLLYLEKQLEHLHTMVESLPTPDPAEQWAVDPAQGMLATEPTRTARTKKVEKALVLAQATKEHPAQTKVITEDVVAGYWTTIRYTTRIAADQKAAILVRLAKLRDAVKVAREQANTVEVQKKSMGAALLTYVFADLAKK